MDNEIKSNKGLWFVLFVDTIFQLNILVTQSHIQGYAQDTFILCIANVA